MKWDKQIHEFNVKFFFLSGSKNARQIKRLPLTIPNESLKSPTLCEFLFWFLIIFVEFKRQGLFLFTFSNVFFSLFCYRNFLFRTEESQKYNTYASKTPSLRSFYKSEISTAKSAFIHLKNFFRVANFSHWTQKNVSCNRKDSVAVLWDMDRAMCACVWMEVDDSRNEWWLRLSEGDKVKANLFFSLHFTGWYIE